MTLYYSLIQFCFWFLFGSVNNFSSVYLLGCGLSNTEIGFIIAAACTLSVLLQPMIATWADLDTSPSLKTMIAWISSFTAAAGIILYFIYGGRAVLCGLIFGLAIVLTQLLTPLVNALATESVNQGKTLNFSLARGVGSLGYAAMSYSLGALVSRFGILIQPGAVTVMAAATLFVTLLFPFQKRRTAAAAPAPNPEDQNPSPRDRENSRFVRESGIPDEAPASGIHHFLTRYRDFCLALAGCVLIYISHVLLNTFTYQIAVSKGGGSEEMGTSMALAAGMELITMFCFPLFLKRREAVFWFRICGIFFTLKCVGTLLAWNIPSFYAVQVFQTLGWGLIAVSSVYYVNSIMEDRDKIKGQAYMTMSYSVGNVAGSFFGGILLDHFGVKGMLVFAILCGAAGTLIVQKAVRPSGSRAAGLS